MHGMRMLRLAGAVSTILALQACGPDSATSPLAPSAGASRDDVPAVGARLGVSKTATGYFNGSFSYDWRVTQTVDKSSAVLRPGGSELFTYSVKATRTGSTIGDGYGVTGQICVRNDGPQATRGLKVVDYLERWDDPTNDWVVFAETQVDVSGNPELPPFMEQPHCYPYDIQVTGTPPASLIGHYRNRARVFIDNFYGEYDPEWAQAPANFTFPAESEIKAKDAKAKVLSGVVCPLGYRCEPFLQYNELAGSADISMQIRVTHASSLCSSTDRPLLGGALLQEVDSRSLRAAWVTSKVRCSAT